MPDDDRHTRDRVRTLDPLDIALRERARKRRESGASPDQLTIPEAEVRPPLRRTLDTILEKLGKPDLDHAARRTRKLARTLRDDGPESLDLCAGHRKSGTQALVDQAIGTVLASCTPEDLIEADEGLALRIGEEFARGAIRRYALDRVSPFTGDYGPDAQDALDLLELADLTFTSTILRGLVSDLMR
ncbi:hypothetical protein [Nocardiopsis sp. L17-MgMaSL7]|uniref:hypothetical protein n=1 Tax=Nocardiopsis sp. L17-MgMaSL7 TaxID=1938893 RepID=UPI000D9A2668|nr:hypothetical protein [Nocardiopsis sp. L17-MgMaSL7]PWV47358.1 hypothetical protein BDW27_112156 [Nocardiopsis sp. L17-MgMaSL7]